MDHLTNVKISIFLRLQLEHFFRGIHAPKIRWNIRSINTNSHAIYCTLNVKLSIELKSKMKKKKNIFFLGVRFVVDVREANTNSMIHNMEHNHTVSHANTLTIILVYALTTTKSFCYVSSTAACHIGIVITHLHAINVKYFLIYF